MFTLRRLSVLVVLAIVVILALPGAPAAAAPRLMAKQANGASPALLDQTPPGRQAQLMAAECRLEQAVIKCVRTANRGWRCGCGPSRSAAAGGNTRSNAPSANTGPDVTSRAKRGGLIAK